MDLNSGEIYPKGAEKKHRQTSIVGFLDEESQRLIEEKRISNLEKSIPKLETDLTPLTPININKDNIVYLTPVVDLEGVTKDKDFYSMDEFTEDMKALTIKKALFENDDGKLNILDESTNAKENTVLLKQGMALAELSKSVSQPGCTEHMEDIKLLQDKLNPQRPRLKKQPNEIFVASLEFPVLIRESAKQDLRQELDNLGITNPFPSNKRSFFNCLEGFGMELVNEYIKNAVLNVKSKNMKSCFYCGFRSESSLVMGSHLDHKHANRLKKWPFSSRMDFTIMKDFKCMKSF